MWDMQLYSELIKKEMFLYKKEKYNKYTKRKIEEESVQQPNNKIIL